LCWLRGIQKQSEDHSSACEPDPDFLAYRLWISLDLIRLILDRPNLVAAVAFSWMSSFSWLDDLKTSDSEAYESIKRYLSTPPSDLPPQPASTSASSVPVLPPLPLHTGDWPSSQGQHKEMASMAMTAPGRSLVSPSHLDQRGMAQQYLPPGASPPPLPREGI
jgi:hypothetical protein